MGVWRNAGRSIHDDERAHAESTASQKKFPRCRKVAGND
jgi:hypothetical protein